MAELLTASTQLSVHVASSMPCAACHCFLSWPVRDSFCFLLSIAAASRVWPHSACSLCTLDRAQHDRDVDTHTAPRNLPVHTRCVRHCTQSYVVYTVLLCVFLCALTAWPRFRQLSLGVHLALGWHAVWCGVVNRTWLVVDVRRTDTTCSLKKWPLHAPPSHHHLHDDDDAASRAD
jgi:hypothetical protein